MYKQCIGLLAMIPLLCVSARAQEVSVSAASAVVIEAESGEIVYAKNAYTARPMASTTKLMTALVAVDALPPDAVATASKQAVAVEGSSLGLRAGDTITMSDLLTGLLLVSGNDAANVVAETVAGDVSAFASLMNAKAAALGMQNSGFVTPSGLDAEGHEASAYDMALLGRAVLKNEFLRQVCATKQTRIRIGDPPREVWLQNHNRLLQLSKDCIGMKTGFTKAAGRCLVSAASRDGVTIVVVTLHAADDWNDHLNLYTYAFSKLERVTPPALKLQPIGVAGGTDTAVELESPHPPAVTRIKGESDAVETTVELPPFLWAPVKKGETVGNVTYRYSEEKCVRLPILAAQDIAVREREPLYIRFWKYYVQICRQFLN